MIASTTETETMFKHSTSGNGDLTVSYQADGHNRLTTSLVFMRVEIEELVVHCLEALNGTAGTEATDAMAGFFEANGRSVMDNDADWTELVVSRAVENDPTELVQQLVDELGRACCNPQHHLLHALLSQALETYGNLAGVVR